MSTQTRRSEQDRASGEPLRSRARAHVIRWTEFLTTPPGSLGLAAFTFLLGAHVALFAWHAGLVPDQRIAAEEAEGRASQELRETAAFYRLQANRLQAVVEHSARYRIPADLARDIYDHARAERLKPDVAYRMVQIESAFQRHAVSDAGAVGYTQIKPSTAASLRPGITRDQLFDRETNLRLGFRYLRSLLDRYDEDLRMALLAYNRGPGRVGSLLAMGRDPSNGYARSVLDQLE